MKRPIESQFEINVVGAGVEAIFKPTQSHYSYNRLVDEKDIARFGPISPARVRHAGPTGDTKELAAKSGIVNAGEPDNGSHEAGAAR